MTPTAEYTHPSHELQSKANIYAELQELFEWRSQSSLIAEPICTHPTSLERRGAALSFYDLHLDQQLVLKKVVLLPNLPNDIARTVDEQLETLRQNQVDLPVRVLDDSFVTSYARFMHCPQQRSVLSPCGIAEHYKETTARFCSAVASTILIHPKAPHWESVLGWFCMERLCVDGLRHWVYESPLLGLFPLTNNAARVEWTTGGTISKCLEQKLAVVKDRFPSLADWSFLCVTPEDETILCNLHFSRRPFSWKYPGTSISTSDRICKSISVPLDSDRLPWKVGAIPTTRRNLARAKKQHPPPAMVTVDSPLSNERRGDYSPTANDIVQHAWVSSVTDDTTLTIFSCGKKERIAVRHRQNQTMYISPLIDPMTATDPAHGKLHVGIYIAAFQDALSRIEPGFSESDSVTPTADQKRRSVAKSPQRSSKRRKVDQPVCTKEDISTRNLCLLQLDFDIYRSPVPLALFRTGECLQQSTYNPPPPLPKKATSYHCHEYLSVTLGAPFCGTTVGVIHPGQIEVRDQEDNTLKVKAVIKLAFTEEDRERLTGEFEIYQHLSDHGVVTGIPQVFGLFENDSEHVSALIMTHCGKSLWDLDRLPTPNERKGFVQAIESINAAGVVHNNLLLEHLLVDDNENATIIDFGISTLRNDVDEYDNFRAGIAEHRISHQRAELYG